MWRPIVVFCSAMIALSAGQGQCTDGECADLFASVAELLQRLGLPQHTQAFQEEGMDTALLLEAAKSGPELEGMLDELSVADTTHRAIISGTLLQAAMTAAVVPRGLNESRRPPLPRQNLEHWLGLCRKGWRPRPWLDSNFVDVLQPVFRVFESDGPGHDDASMVDLRSNTLPRKKLRARTRLALISLRSAILHAELTEVRTQAFLGLEDMQGTSRLRYQYGHVGQEPWCGDFMRGLAKRTEAEDDAVSLVLLFVLGMPVPQLRVEHLLGVHTLSTLSHPDVGLLRCEAASAAPELPLRGKPHCWSLAQLHPTLQDTLVFADFMWMTASLGAGHPVMYLGIDSHAMLHTLPKDQPRVEAVIDMCTGSGIQAIAALQYFADSAVLVDLNPRAARFAIANLHLNDIEEHRFDVRVGSDWGPVAEGERFDILLINPPYLATEEEVGSGHLYGNGGMDGEAISSKVMRGALPHLKPCAKIFLVGNLYNPQQWPRKIRRWLGEGTEQHSCEDSANRDSCSVAVRIKKGHTLTIGSDGIYAESLQQQLISIGITEVALEGLVFVYLRPDHRPSEGGVGGTELDEIWKVHSHPWQWLHAYTNGNAYEDRATVRRRIAEEVQEQHWTCQDYYERRAAAAPTRRQMPPGVRLDD